MTDRRSWFKRAFKLDYDEKFDAALELIHLQEFELDRTASAAADTRARVDGIQEAVRITVKRVDEIESKIDAIRDFDFGGRRMLAQFDVEQALSGDTTIRVQLDNVNHEARLRYGSVDVVDTIDAVWFISKTGVPIDNDFGDVLHPNAQRRDVIEFLKRTSDLQGSNPLPGDPTQDIQDLNDKLDQEITDREEGDKDLQSQIDQHLANHPSGGGGGNSSDPFGPVTLDLGNYGWKRTNKAQPGTAGHYPNPPNTVAVFGYFSIAYENAGGHDQSDKMAQLVKQLDADVEVTLAFTTDEGTVSWTIKDYDDTPADNCIKFTLDKPSVTGDQALLDEDASLWPNDASKIISFKAKYQPAPQWVPVEGGEFEGPIFGPVLDLVTPGVVVLKSDGARPTGGASTPGHLNVWHEKVADATTDPPNELKVHVGAGHDDLIDRGPTRVWLILGDKTQEWDCNDSGWTTDSGRVWHVSAHNGVTGDDLDLDVDTEIVMTRGGSAPYATLEGVEAITEHYAVSRVHGGEFHGPISGPALEPVTSALSDTLTLKTVGTLDNTAPPAGEVHIVSGFNDTVPNSFKVDLGSNASAYADREDVYYVLAQATGSVTWYCEGKGEVINNTTLKVTADNVLGDDLFNDRQVLLFTSSRDSSPYTTITTVDRMIKAYLATLPDGVDQAELDKKVDKDGDLLTGTLSFRPSTTGRFLGLKGRVPKNADGTNNTSDLFGVEIDIDELNTYRSTFRVASRYGSILKVSGGADPGVQVGPVNSKQDPTDPDNVIKPVPLRLSGAPSEEDHAVNKEYVDHLIANISEDVTLDWVDYGDYNFKRSSDGQSTGSLKCQDPSGPPMAKDVKRWLIHKTNKGGTTHDASLSWTAGNFLKVSKGVNAGYYMIEDDFAADSSNTVIMVRWLRGDDNLQFFVNDVLHVEEGVTRGSDYAHLASSNVFTKDNTFDGGITTWARPGGYGFKDFVIKGQVAGGSETDVNLLEVNRNQVTDANEDAINYYGKMSSGPNIVTVHKAQELAQKKVDDLRVELLEAIDNADVPRFYKFPDRIETTAISGASDFPMVTPNSYFMPTNSYGNASWNEWPGNITYLNIKVNDEIINSDLATGMGNFTIRDSDTNEIMVAGMINDFSGKVTMGNKPWERFHVEKWGASGARWQKHKMYYLALSGTHWEPRA